MPKLSDKNEDDSDSMSAFSVPLTPKERIDFEYLKKRDPMREYFALVSGKSANCFVDFEIS